SSLLYFFFFYSRPDIPTLPSFPTRRSSDLRLSSCGGRTGPRMTVSPFLVQTADFVSPAIPKEVFSGYSRDRDERTPESSPSFVFAEALQPHKSGTAGSRSPGRRRKARKLVVPSFQQFTRQQEKVASGRGESPLTLH